MVGEIAENFVLKDHFGKEFDLYENLQTKLLLAFYPKDETMICSKQLSDYNINKIEFEKQGIKVIGINTGSINSHSSFCNKLDLNIIVLSDIKKEVSKMFSALNIFGVNKRKLVLIDTDKKILFEKTSLALLYPSTQKTIRDINKLFIQ